ncbi:MAG: 50S ribosomal protein L23 [Thermotoga sp. 50_1627]|uniref:50S ribosomal protein L23 n=1 Tax=Pseudothermotoga sp. TaxID=2033661 RepID=UPI00076CFB70|nr:MAG: 50S ribosomal protein L23 [Thermotoga sp. 50_64]KUK25377.1 MAG: 50S ribosomal protein L23 [Thermotoga sp. 50_1627]MBC7116804.1 50S ribosomal protein L23 [Pseudothermotoga sp.]MDK2923136.1 large subunit ribosomal protein [Pseudothermotoga sp.]HBT39634.1 50S ribosomal protein L23 [Pseudothermotoga sp.]
MNQQKLTPFDVIVRPIVTEKSMAAREGRKYIFEVNLLANKHQVKMAIEKLFNVKVEKVNVLLVKPKPKRRGLFEGTTRQWKKAIVTLKEGYTIKELEAQQ